MVEIRQLCYRLVASRFPPIPLFEQLLDSEELEAAYALERLTNRRLREEAGDISLIAPEDRVVGPGSSPIMSAFTHTGAESRFSRGDYGVYYAGLDLQTALAESAFSRSRFLSATAEGPQVLSMRCYSCEASGLVEDLRGDTRAHAANDFSYPQAKALRLRREGVLGLLYRSLRHQGGECLAALKPTLLEPPAVAAGDFQFHWTGSKISTVLRVEVVS
jgi:hypothetical protein